MTDLLVKLYDLPDPGPRKKLLAKRGIHVQRALAGEKNLVAGWVKNQFGEGWAAECEIAFYRNPIACMIAVARGRLVGFACHDCTCLNFFGPIGIDSSYRDRGIGSALLLATLASMGHAGFAYAIIGGAGPVPFFQKCVNAISIPGSTPGIYRPFEKRIQHR